MKTHSKLLIAAVSVALMIAGCGGSGSGTNPTGSAVFQSITGSLPGMGGAKAQQAMQGAQFGAKLVDAADLSSPQRQEEIGQSVAVAITNRYSLSTDQVLNDYVALVGLTVASVAPNADINYAFGVLETPEVAAYSAPGGYVFLSRGAIALMQDESELAGVLAHEVAHVAMNHGIEAIRAAKGADLVVSGVNTFESRAAAFSQYIDVAADAILVKGHSRDQESKADVQAVKYLAAARYDSAGLLRFLQRMQSTTGAGGGLKQLMSTHPGTAERISAIQREVASRPTTGAKLPERFATNVKSK